MVTYLKVLRGQGRRGWKWCWEGLKMPLHTGQVLDVLDAQQRPVGQMTIERREADLLYGNFVPGSAFPAMAQLFRDFEEAVNSQALSTVDALDAAIAALGLYLRGPDGPKRVEIHDVQIWTDGAISCKLPGQALEVENGHGESTQSVRPASVKGTFNI